MLNVFLNLNLQIKFKLSSLSQIPSKCLLIYSKLNFLKTCSALLFTRKE